MARLARFLCAAVLALAARLQQNAAGPTISANVSELDTHGQAITVTVTGVTDPKDTDAVALLVPYDANRSVVPPQKFQWLLKGSAGKGYLKTGASNLTFNVLAREPFLFILARDPGTLPGAPDHVSFDWLNYTVLAESTVIDLTSHAMLEPTQLHLLATNSSSRVGIQWTTAAEYPAGVTPTVHYIAKGGNLTQSAEATSDTYTAADLCGGIANASGYIYPGALPFGTCMAMPCQFYTAYMADLEPNTEYEYYVGAAAPGRRRLLAAEPDDRQRHYGYSVDILQQSGAMTADHALHAGAKAAAAMGGTPSFSDTYSFLSPPTSEDTVGFLLYADQGFVEVDGTLEWDNDYPNPITLTAPDKVTTDPGTVTVQFDNVLNEAWVTYGAGFNTTMAMLADVAANLGYSLAVHNGDISYAQGFTYGWDQYWENVEPLYTQIPLATIIGNHERDWPGTVDQRSALANNVDSGGECGVIYDKRLGLGMPIVKQLEYYSFDHGPIHFLQFNTEVDFYQGSEQWEFIAADLAAVDRSVTLWLIVGFHRPYYTPSGQSRDTRELQAAFDDLFMRYQVDFTTYGHVHMYSRTCPVYKRICQPNDEDGATTAPVHLLTGHVRLLPLPRFAKAGASLQSEVVLNPAAPYYKAIDIAHGYVRINASRTRFAVEVVDSVTGNFLDAATYTKPDGWQPDMARQNATIAGYANGSYVPVPFEKGGAPSYSTIVRDVEGYIFNDTKVRKKLVSNALVQNPEAPDWLGDMNPCWQTLDQIFGAHFNATTKETSSHYTEFWHPLFMTFKNNPNGVFVGPYVNKTVPALPPWSLYSARASPIPNLAGMKK